MKTPLSVITLGAVAAMVTIAAPAQSSSSSSSQSNPSLQQASTQEFFRSSDLVGKNTQDSKGNKVGEIKDIAFNQQGEVFAFISVGSSKYAVVPWQAIQAASAKGSGNVTVNATQQQLKAGPAVTKEQWGSLNNPQFVQGCYSYYNLQPPTATGGASSPGASQSGGASSSSSVTDTNQAAVSSSGSQADTNQSSGAASSPGGSSQSSGSSSSSLTDTNQSGAGQSPTNSAPQ